MDLQQLRYVVAVAELGSFTRAAERCFVVQSALSHQIARLESELGTRLFARTSRQVRLTTAGSAFLPGARQCLAAAERARADVAAATGEVRGTLAVGIIPTVAAVDVPTALRAFHDSFPLVRVSLSTGVSEQLVTRVIEGTLDVAFLGLPPGARVDGVNDHVFAEDRLVAVVAVDHVLAGRQRVTLRRLTQEVFVDFPIGSGGRAQSDQAFAAAGLHRDVAFEVTDAHMMARLIRQGLGVGMLAATFAPQLPELATIPVTGAPTRREHLVWSRLDPSPAADAFLRQLGVLVPASPPGSS